jgi:uncharacterized protein YceH (UPF0502 family)
MALTDPEVRVLAALIEKEAAVPESYPLTLNALRLACNQTTNRRPVVSYDDRTVEAALLSLKSVGLVRFVHPSHGGRTTRYRHAADERWRLSAGELLVLSALALRGPQTVAEIRARVGRLMPAGDTATVEEILDTLAARSPEALVERVDRRSGERDDRWTVLIGEGSGAGDDDTGPLEVVEPAWRDEPTAGSIGGDDLDAIRGQLAAVVARLDRLEQRLDDIWGRPVSDRDTDVPQIVE